MEKLHRHLMSRICRNKNMLSELHGRGFHRIVCTVAIVSLTEGVRSPVPSFSPALRPCRKQWRSSFPLDRQAGGADEHSHCLRSQDESAGSLPRQQRWRNVSDTATLCSLWHKPERAPLPPLNKSLISVFVLSFLHIFQSSLLISEANSNSCLAFFYFL